MGASCGCGKPSSISRRSMPGARNSRVVALMDGTISAMRGCSRWVRKRPCGSTTIHSRSNTCSLIRPERVRTASRKWMPAQDLMGYRMMSDRMAMDQGSIAASARKLFRSEVWQQSGQA